MEKQLALTAMLSIVQLPSQMYSLRCCKHDTRMASWADAGLSTC